ncbi:hypothetical protein ANSO36C_18770 [Nostoc cf. commune SO-36]|uniref:Carbohydrate kinase FGGY N-terminal domain-containing protein n=1 Tax=Nostoc cf. commune SO-36 TaxID=449208 RepID=A0ABN6Q1F3_NOSCO|nr:FGGY family carbohydrate kinase [Nostoc commune]BDI16075.1 hypothetical protein ANSO36C_18770 [Nostoc cf. commune SO-36]
MLLGIDLGTGSAKALLLATDGTAIGEASRPYPVHAPHPGWAESEPGDWWLAVAWLLGRQWEIMLIKYRRSHFQDRCMVLF